MTKLRLLIVLTALLISISSVGIICGNAATVVSSEPTCYYTNIKIQRGDTLNHIADIYANNTYITKCDYVKEIKRINGLNSDTIHAGCYLTIVYYN